MAQAGQAPARRCGAAGRAARLARPSQARRRGASRRHFRHHRDRRGPRPRHQFPPVAQASGLVYGDTHPFHLRLLRRDLRRRRGGLRRRLVGGSAAAAQANEPLRLQQASVRSRGRRSVRERRQTPAAMGRPQVLQRVRPERVSQGRDGKPDRQALRRRERRQVGPPVQVPPRQRRRRRPETGFHLCRRRGRGAALADRHALGLGHLQRRHRQGPQLPRPDHRAVSGARPRAADRICRHAAGGSRSVSIFHPSQGRKPAPGRLQRQLRFARGRGEPVRQVVPEPGRPLPMKRTGAAAIQRQVPMFDFEESLKLISEQTIVCVGDLMLDDFVYGEVSRISPEAPAPILAVTRNDLTVGGAGNVARNIAALGARCVFLGVVGEDDASRTLMRALAAEPLIEPHLVIDPARPTTRKVRFVSEHHSTHLLRADWELVQALNAKTEKALIDRTLAALPRAASVVLSDYAKGTLTPRVIRNVIDAAKEAKIPIIVDPKAVDYSIYRGATVIKPNRKELAEATRRRADSDDDVIAAASELNRLLGTDAVVVSLSDAGLILVPANGAALHVPAYPVKLRDTSGAGDTVVAALAVMLATKVDYEPAVRAANAAAAVVVGKRGTATVSAAELRSRILPAASLAPEEKVVFDWSVLDERLAEWRGLRIGFTNGCFDLLHPGHIKLLSEAHAACDRLIVGLNDDASVRRLKGEGRPLQEVHARAEVLAALEAVDLVVIFGQDTPLELIRRVRPKVLVKGGDYRREEVVGREFVEGEGGEVILIDLVPGFSTTEIVRQSRPPARVRRS